MSPLEQDLSARELKFKRDRDRPGSLRLETASHLNRLARSEARIRRYRVAVFVSASVGLLMTAAAAGLFVSAIHACGGLR